jgi:hypothetical protein
MRRHNGFGGQTGLFVGLLGLIFSCAQGCANGDTKQNNDETTGGAGTDLATGGSSSEQTTQGGTSTQASSAFGGVTSVGGSAAGGVTSSGAGSAMGGATTTTQAAGGSVTGGGSAVGGITSAGGDTSNTGGAPPETGGAATGGTPAIECKTSLNCLSAPDNQTVCNSAGVCVQCEVPDDCGIDGGANHDCINSKCVEFTPCGSDDDCSTGACNTAKHRCVDCTQDGQCGSGKKCLDMTCRTTCASDNNCTPQGMLCDKTLTVCIECNDQVACKNGQVCDSYGKCVAPVCNAGDKTCLAGGVGTCLANGSGFVVTKACPADSTCQVKSGKLACYYEADGGVACDVSGDPCVEISEFDGTQTVDGLGDDFCGVPSAILDGTHNQGVKDFHTRATEVATFQVAWSAAGLHVFVDVQDKSVQTVQMADPTQALTKTYQGDSIELLFSSSNTVTGLTGTDTNTLHVQIPASGPAVSVKTSNVSGASQGTSAALPAAQYAQKITPTGYAIEALLPWPGSKPNMGTTIRFDLTLNGADTNFSTVDDMRDGSLYYHLGTVANSTCQSNDGTVPYCDDRTWCATPLK